MNDRFPEIKAKYEGLKNLQDLAETLKDLADKHLDLKKQAAEVWEEVEYLRKILGPELMGDETLVKWKDFPWKMLQQEDIYASATHGITEELKDWLFENGGEALVKDTVNSSALKAFLRKRLAEGKPIPKRLFKVEPYSFVKVVKA